MESTTNPQARLKLLGDAQRYIANDAVNDYLYQPKNISVANKHLKGLWKNLPIWVNDMSAVHWE